MGVLCCFLCANGLGGHARNFDDLVHVDARGHHGFGVEADEKAFDALASYLKTYLRTKRIKHSAQVSRVRREGRSLGRRLDAEARLDEATHDHPAQPGAPRLKMTVFTGDTRDSAALFGRKRFDAIVTDAPYGVVHGAEQNRTMSFRQCLWSSSPGSRGAQRRRPNCLSTNSSEAQAEADVAYGPQ